MGWVDVAESVLGISRPVLAAFLTASEGFQAEKEVHNSTLQAQGLPAIVRVETLGDTGNIIYHMSDGSRVKAVFIELGKGAE